jgi:hypothetical protein
VSKSDDTAPIGWENGLSDVINYTNSDLSNNYTFLAFYALPIAYFTDHPVIDLTSSYGVAAVYGLIGMTNSMAASRLLESGVHYLLIPSPGNDNYAYYLSISRNFTFLSPQSLAENSSFVRIAVFARYNLYLIKT